jgi:hypothetical protein|tara:strand:- start:257 stop:763 length:507 start_codon:yes stop_codon:yes gene_type:complete
MAFIIESGNTLSFAEYDDVYNRDQRLFENNEGLTDDIIEDILVRSTERILTQLRASEWWKSYYLDRSSVGITSSADIPSLDAGKIKARLNDFTDLCVYTALAEYILPKVADFGNEDNAERQKIGYYNNKSESLFGELITAGDWYDFDNDGTISSDEKDPGQYNLKRIR